MKTRMIILPLLLGAVLFFSFRFLDSPRLVYVSKSPTIIGTWKFMSRTLPDGTVLKPPMVDGITTFTKDIRNFSVMWTDKNGKHTSFTVYSNYKLTDKDYSESLIYGIMNDEIGGKGITYTTDQKKTVPITFDGKKLDIKMPFDPVTVTFEGNKMTAVNEGQFTDVWEKVR